MAGSIATTITTSYSLNVNPTTILSTGAVVVASQSAIFGPSGMAWTLVNSGLISNTGTYNDIFLQSGGSVINTGSGTIDGNGIAIQGTGTVLNSGRITGTGTDSSVFLTSGGSVSNAATGTISGNGIALGGFATVVNAGSIYGGVQSISFLDGGSVTNASTGVIIGGADRAIGFGTTQGTVVNDGTITGGYNGVAMGGANNVVVNSGLIANTSTGDAVIYIGSGTVTNTGSIIGGTGIYFGAGSGAGTVINAGTLSGLQAAIQFATGYSNLLVDEPGAVFIGGVDGGNTISGTIVSALELASGASAGTFAGLGSQFVDFGQAAVDAGATWTLTGSNTIATGETFTDNGTLANTGTITGGITLGSGASLSNVGGTITQSAGVALYSAAAGASVSNTGVILENAGTFSAISINGSVSNAVAGTISGWRGVHFTGAAGTLFNAGTIAATGTTLGAGVALSLGGSVSNAATGTISSAYGSAIYMTAASGSIINAGDIINSGTSGLGVELRSGGIISNAATGTISSVPQNAILVSGGSGTIVNAGLVTNTGIASGADIALLSGGLVSNASTGTISSVHRTDVYIIGGVGTVVNAGQILTADTHTSVVLMQGGSVANQAGGTIHGGHAHSGIYITGGTGTVTNAGMLIGGYASGVHLHMGGAVTNQAGGTITSGQTLHSSVYTTGASSAIVNAGVIHAIAIESGGTVTNQAGGLIAGDYATGVFIGGGAGTVTNAGMITGVGTFAAVSFAPGFADRLVVDPGATFSGHVNGGNVIGSTSASTLELAPAAAAGTLAGLGTQIVNFGSIVFDTGADWFISGNTNGLAGIISGFSFGDTIELTGVTATGSNFASGILTLTGSAAPATLALTGSFATSDFVVTDVPAGTDVTLIACFREGTRIRTTRGDIAVEDLRVGDEIARAADGSAAPVIWIGRRDIDCMRHPRPRQVWPIRIAKGTFGNGQPYRDLFLSPDHAVFVDDVLIPMKHLVNGATIMQVPVRHVTYYHVELARHDVLLADGLPVESYLDTGHRADFAARNVIALHPDFASRVWDAAGCAPLVVAGPRLDAVRARIRMQCALDAASG